MEKFSIACLWIARKRHCTHSFNEELLQIFAQYVTEMVANLNKILENLLLNSDFDDLISKIGSKLEDDEDVFNSAKFKYLI